MPYSYNLSQEAEDDMLEAHGWYEQQRSGLGEEFLASLDKARQSILQTLSLTVSDTRKKLEHF